MIFPFAGWGQCFEFPTVLRQCWLGHWKGITACKNPHHLSFKFSSGKNGTIKAIMAIKMVVGSILRSAEFSQLHNEEDI